MDTDLMEIKDIKVTEEIMAKVTEEIMVVQTMEWEVMERVMVVVTTLMAMEIKVMDIKNNFIL